MIGKLFRLSTFLFVYACVGTSLAVMVGLAYAWNQGWLTSDKVVQFLEVAYDIDPMLEEEGKSDEAAQGQDSALERVGQFRVKLNRDLEIRETSLNNRLQTLHMLEKELDEKVGRLENLRNEFEQELQQIRDAAATEGIKTIATLLENMKDTQAKDQLMRMSEAADGIEDVVLLLKTIRPDARAKIIQRFKAPDEEKVIAEVLRELKKGDAAVELVDRTRAGLEGGAAGP